MASGDIRTRNTASTSLEDHMKMSSRNRMAMGIAVIAGILLFISGITGVSTWETIKDYVSTHIGDNSAIQIIFAVLIFIASLGGIAVIIGGIFIGKNRVGTGKFVIAIGVGLGLIGLIVIIIMTYMENSFVLGLFPARRDGAEPRFKVVLCFVCGGNVCGDEHYRPGHGVVQQGGY